MRHLTDEDLARKEALLDVDTELRSAIARFPAMRSPHEGWAIIQEECDELWEIVRQKNKQRDESGGQDEASMRYEAMQIAAMAVRFMVDLT